MSGTKTDNLIALSPSRIKTYQSCTWLYYCKYVLKLPDESNDGAKRGTICHSILEFLLRPDRPKRKEYYQKIIQNNDVYCIPSIKKYVRLALIKENISGEFDNKGNHNFNLIGEMILVGLKYDYYCDEKERPHKILREGKFDYIDPKGRFRTTGFIDKLPFYSDSARIDDYKTSQSKFAKNELKSNIQALIYSHYVKRVHNIDSFVRFIFLRFPDEAEQIIRVKESVLTKLEEYLTQISKELSNFTYSDALSNMAAYQNYPGKDDGFKGRSMCGRSKFQGELKKDGTPMYSCTFKWEMTYWQLQNKDGKILKTAMKKSELTKTEKGDKIRKMTYLGCPAFNKEKYQVF